jgi:hypothetical protein
MTVSCPEGWLFEAESVRPTGWDAAEHLWTARAVVDDRGHLGGRREVTGGAERGQRIRAVIEQSPVQLPSRVTVGQRRSGGQRGQPDGDVVAGGRSPGQRGGQRKPVRIAHQAGIDLDDERPPGRLGRLVVGVVRFALQVGCDLQDAGGDRPPVLGGGGVAPRGEQLWGMAGHPAAADSHAVE